MSTYFDQFSILCYFKSLLKCTGTCIHECLIPVIVPYNCHPCISELLRKKTFLLLPINKDTGQPVHSWRQKCYTVNIQPNRLLCNLCNSALMFECYFVANREYKVSCDMTHFVQASSCDDKQHGQGLHILLQMVAELFSCDLIQARMGSID